MEYEIDNIRYKETSYKGYFISMDGDVAQIKFRDNGKVKSYFLMNQEITSDGYARIEIDHHHKLVHRLVYETWSDDELDPNLVIDHIDANPSNNNIFNLRQVPQKENINNAILHGNFGHNHNTKIKVYDDVTNETKVYDSVKSFLIDINAPRYIIDHGGLSGLNKRVEYKRYHVYKIDER